MDKIYCDNCDKTYSHFVEGELPHGCPIGYCPDCGKRCYLTYDSMYES